MTSAKCTVRGCANRSYLTCRWCDQPFCTSHLVGGELPVVPIPPLGVWCAVCGAYLRLLAGTGPTLVAPSDLGWLVRDGYLLRATFHPAYTTPKFYTLVSDLELARRLGNVGR